MKRKASTLLHKGCESKRGEAAATLAQRATAPVQIKNVGIRYVGLPRFFFGLSYSLSNVLERYFLAIRFASKTKAPAAIAGEDRMPGHRYRLNCSRKSCLKKENQTVKIKTDAYIKILFNRSCDYRSLFYSINKDLNLLKWD